MDTHVISLLDVVDGTSTNLEGAKLYAALKPYLATGTLVQLSMRGASPMSSSFLNSSIGDLIDHYGITALRNSLKLIDYLPSHAGIIKKYVDDLVALQAV